ncbi:hypothetical protein ACN38_g8216 [Penicillium nordicum]|uniref:Uncharacterized protein n=1 Tax=Penicillium nordicum TaxID=229535 RepID=A0A0M8P0B1_9EURO|nr:hypothetical protein ACN38_g8216 [Penicillium nordicum]
MMDPFSALSLATSVIQFVDFATKLTSKGKELYRSTDGILADHAEKSAISSKLSTLSKGLLSSLDGISATQRLSAAQEGLRDIAQESYVIAEDFLVTLDELKVATPGRKWTSFRQALKSVWNKDKLEERMTTLDRLGQVVIIHLLLILNEDQIKSFATTTNEIQTMEGRVRDTLSEYRNEIKQELGQLLQQLNSLAIQARTQSTSEDDRKREIVRKSLLDEWRNENDEVLAKILQTLQQKADDQNRRSFKRMFFDTLYFSRMHDRENMIDSKYDLTLGWVFRTPTDMGSKWFDLPSWLCGPGGLYWVSGKAGSGKSTFMKWLLHEPRTREALDVWAGDKPLLITSHFIWSSGTEEQKSVSGMLRCLLYELLIQWPDPIWELSPSRWRSWDLELGHFPAWSDDELIHTLQSFLRRSANHHRICLFIDGLDELAGDDDRLEKVFRLLRESSQCSHIKICVSSRPWELLKNNYSSYPHLRLEDLTYSDIELYINTRLQANERFRALQQQDPRICSQLVCEMIEKAKGVWLWVILVSRSLLRGLTNHDTATDLLDRLRGVPEELEAYFLQMFAKIESFYRVKSLKLLRLALYSPGGVSLMTCSFLDEDHTAFLLQTATQPFGEEEVVQRLQRAKSRVNIFCLDLLETTDWGSGRHVFYRQSVEFLHRTARDFLLENTTQHLLQMQNIEDFNVNIFTCRALLAQMQMLEQPTRLLVADFMKHAALLEEESPEALLPLTAHLDKLLDSQRDKPWSDDSLPACPVKGWDCNAQGPKPLLSLAIQHGLTGYVQTCLTSNPNLVFKQQGRPLLDYALRRRIYSPLDGQAEQLDYPVGGPRDQPNQRLILLILQHGGNPNERLGSSTPWKLYLGYLSTFAKELNQLDKSSLQPWIQTTELLIQYGAARVLERHTIIPRQSTGRTRVKLSYRDITAWDSLAAAFGATEADRLYSLSWKLDATGQSMLWNSVRNVRNFLRWVG